MHFRQSARVGVIIGGGLLCLSLALREGVGWDYHSYTAVINAKGFAGWEPIPRLFGEIASYFGNPQVFFAICGFVTCMNVTFVAVRERSAVPLLGFLALPIFFFEALSVVRQGLALSYSILAYYYFQRGSRKGLVSAGLFAVLSHRSAIIFIVVLWALRKRKGTSLSALVAGSALSAVLLPILFPYLLDIFPVLTFYQSGGSFGLTSIIFWAFWLLLSFDRHQSVTPYGIALSGILISFALMDFDSVLLRASWYFYIPFLFLNYERIFGVFSASKIIVVFAFWFAFGLSLYYKSILAVGPALPYRSILW